MSALTNRSVVLPKPTVKPMSKMELFTAFAMGKLFEVRKDGLYHTGLITGITLESGFTPPDSPHHFNVTIVNQYTHQTTVVYVKTVD